MSPKKTGVLILEDGTTPLVEHEGKLLAFDDSGRAVDMTTNVYAYLISSFARAVGAAKLIETEPGKKTKLSFQTKNKTTNLHQKRPVKKTTKKPKPTLNVSFGEHEGLILSDLKQLSARGLLTSNRMDIVIFSYTGKLYRKRDLKAFAEAEKLDFSEEIENTLEEIDQRNLDKNLAFKDWCTRLGLDYKIPADRRVKIPDIDAVIYDIAEEGFAAASLGVDVDLQDEGIQKRLVSKAIHAKPDTDLGEYLRTNHAGLTGWHKFIQKLKQARHNKE